MLINFVILLQITFVMKGNVYFKSLHAGQFFMLLLSSADFFQNELFRKIMI